jgi:hypothetical protein
MDAIKKVSVKRDYSSYTPAQIRRYLGIARVIESVLVKEMARSANLLVVTKQIKSLNSVIDAVEIAEVLHTTQKKVLEHPDAQKLPLNWPFETANRFNFETQQFLTGKQANKELGMQVLRMGNEIEIELLFGSS